MNTLVKGSLSDLAQQEGKSLAETFLGADAVLLVDMSGSMGAKDAPGGRSRYDAAEDELRRLQEQLPGKVAVVAFSSHTQFCPDGRPPRLGGGTNMAEALRFIRPVDGAGVKIILISDGQPDDEQATLAVARTFQTAISTIFIGPETGYGSGGRQFLEQLARASGGQFHQSKAPGMLEDDVTQLLLDG